MNKDIRIPRIKGITSLSRYYKVSYEEKSFYVCINHIMAHYLQNGFTYLGIPLSLPQLSMYLGIREETLQSCVLDVSNPYLGAFKSSDLAVHSGTRAQIFSSVISWILSEKSTIFGLKELILREIQYPKTLALRLPQAHLLLKTIEMDSKLMAQMVSLIGQAFPAARPTNILQIQGSTVEKAEKLTASEAMELIGPVAQMYLDNPDKMKELAERHGLNDPDLIPEVRASGALDTDGTFIKTSKSMMPNDTLDTLIIDFIDDLEASDSEIID